MRFVTTSCLLVVLLLAGCAVQQAFTCPGPSGYKNIQPGDYRSEVESGLGQPVTTRETEKGLRLGYDFDHGPPVAFNVFRGIVWLAADVYTCCLSEIIEWPIELGIRSAIDGYTAKVIYDSNGKVISAKVFNPDGELIFSTASHEKVETY